METWLIYFITFMAFMGLSSIGIFIYSRKRLREKVNLKEVWQLFWIIMILKVFDILSTIYFTNKLGIAYEGNLIARAFMFQFGIIPGLIMITLLLMPMFFFWFVLVNFMFKNKSGWLIFKMIMIAISVIVPLINISV